MNTSNPSKPIVYQNLTREELLDWLQLAPTSTRRQNLTREELIVWLKLSPSEFEFLTDKEKDDDELALTAVVHKLDNYIKVSTRLNQSKKFLMQVLDGCIQKKSEVVFGESVLSSSNGANMWFWNALSPSYKDDEEVALKLLDAWSGIDFPLWRLSEKIRDNFTVAKKAVTLNPLLLAGVGDTMKKNIEIASSACMVSSVYNWAHEDIRNDGTLLQAVYQKSIGSFFEIIVRDEDLKKSSHHLVRQAMKHLSLGDGSPTGFYREQFKKVEALVLQENQDLMGLTEPRDTEKDPPETVPEGLQLAMYHIIDHLDEGSLNLLVEDSKTKFGAEAIHDAIFKLVTHRILKDERVKDKKKRRLQVG